MSLGFEKVKAKVTARKAVLKAALQALLPEPREIVFEIGCGHGHFLTAYAEAHSQSLCLGIDIMNKRITRSKRKQKRGELTNVHFMLAEANETLESLPENVTIKKTFILFLDPWPKRKHHKNRLIQEDFLKQLAPKCTKDALVYFRTDHNEYFDWAVDIFNESSFWNIAPQHHWPFEKETIFQDKADNYQSFIAERVL